MRVDTVTLDELKEWPPLVSVVRAGQALGISTTTAYKLLRMGVFPVPALKLGADSKVRTADLVRFLSGADDEEPAA